MDAEKRPKTATKLASESLILSNQRENKSGSDMNISQLIN